MKRSSFPTSETSESRPWPVARAAARATSSRRVRHGGRARMAVMAALLVAVVAGLLRANAQSSSSSSASGAPARSAGQTAPAPSSGPAPAATTPETPVPMPAAAPSPAVKATAQIPATAVPPNTLPQQGGLPVNVQSGVYFLKVESIQENENTFTGTIDVRLRWKDSRLAAVADVPLMGFRDYSGAAATARLAEIWTPEVEISNMVKEPTYNSQVLRIFTDGRVELLRRVGGTFSSEFNPQNFPFDHQKLRVKLVMRGEDSQRVTLDFRQSDLDFSRIAYGVDVSGWKLGLVDILRESEAGLHGESHSSLSVELETNREISAALAPIFIPLFASLLIPLMAIYLNILDDGDFQIDAFELCNIVIGGLFAVIALNFTVNSTYQSLGGTDNPVSRLFSLNYLALGAALTVIICMFHFNVVKRMFGKYVQEQLYVFMIWAGPLLLFATSVAILMAAAA